MMRAYMGYSLAEGWAEGAVLVFAPNSKLARKMAYEECSFWNVENWLDQGIKWLRDPKIFMFADQEKLKNDVPHVIYDPACCETCETWGANFDHQGICNNCNKYVGDELFNLYTKYWENHNDNPRNC